MGYQERHKHNGDYGAVGCPENAGLDNRFDNSGSHHERVYPWKELVLVSNSQATVSWMFLPRNESAAVIGKITQL